MAHKKAAGSTRNGRDSNAQRLGVKIYGDQRVTAGGIIIRQHGCQYNAGVNVGKADDDTLYSLIEGVVKFKKVMRRKFSGTLQMTRFVSVEPVAA